MLSCMHRQQFEGLYGTIQHWFPPRSKTASYCIQLYTLVVVPDGSCYC
jgi:hypothetical protein